MLEPKAKERSARLAQGQHQRGKNMAEGRNVSDPEDLGQSQAG